MGCDNDHDMPEFLALLLLSLCQPNLISDDTPCGTLMLAHRPQQPTPGLGAQGQAPSTAVPAGAARLARAESCFHWRQAQGYFVAKVIHNSPGSGGR